MRKISRLARALCLIGVALMLAAWALSARVPAYLQYAVSAPDQIVADPEKKADPPIKGEIQKLEEAMGALTDTVSAYAVVAYAPSVQLTYADQSQKADLSAVFGAYQELFPIITSAGRRFTPEEVRYGDRVAIVSAQLAVDLFRVSDPTGRTIELDGVQYQVIGVSKRGRSVEDASNHQIYLPLAAIIKDDKTALKTLTVSARPLSFAGAEVALQEAMRAWRDGGSFFVLSRERVRALLLPRVLLSAALLLLLIGLFKGLYALARREGERLQSRLKDNYFTALMPGVVARALAGLLLLGALSALCVLWANFAAQPVLLFPEWVPEVPVEWSDIEKTFWALRYAANARTEYLTGEVLCLRFFAGMANAGCVLVLSALSLRR